MISISHHVYNIPLLLHWLMTELLHFGVHAMYTAMYIRIQSFLSSESGHKGTWAVGITGYYAEPACYTSSVNEAGGPKPS